MDPFARVVRALLDHDVRFVVIGVWGVNYYAHGGAVLFTTQDRDLFLPPDAENLLRTWESCSEVGLGLRCGSDPLDLPRDVELARAVIERQAATIATDDSDLQVDLSLVMAGFQFDDVWRRCRRFRIDGVEVPVARLEDIVTSKANAGREKDRLFLATHAEALKQLLREDARTERRADRSSAHHREGDA